MNKPLVSIVMATFNRASQLKDTIDNIYQQEYSNLELIVINDGSSDNTLDTLKNIQKTYKFVILNNSENFGLQKSLNLGVQQAKGKYIARIDDHDIWIIKSKLTRQVSFMELNSKVGIVGTGYKVNGKNMINPITDTEIRNQILLRSPFCHVSVLMLKSVLDQVGGYNENLSYSEDWDLWLNMGRYSEFANLPDIMVAIQEEDLSLSGNYFLKQLPINRQIAKRYYKYYPRKIRAFLYHQFLRLFFAVAPVNGFFHKLMKSIFLHFFTLLPKKNVS